MIALHREWFYVFDSCFCWLLKLDLQFIIRKPLTPLDVQIRNWVLWNSLKLQ